MEQAMKATSEPPVSAHRAESPHGQALAAKERGNEAFRAEEYVAALGHYDQAIAAITVSLAGAGGQEAALESLKHTVLSNRAEVNLRLGNFEAALGDSREVSGAAEAKARFRGAVAALTLGRTADARERLDKCSGGCAEAQRAIRELQLDLEEDGLWAAAAASARAAVAGSCEGKAEPPPELLLKVERIVTALLDESSDEDSGALDADPSALLQQLSTALRGGDGASAAEACALFSECRGFPAVMSWLSGPCHDKASDVLLAASGGEDGLSPRGICRWPRQAVRQLAGRCELPAGSRDSGEAAGSLALLAKVARCPRTRCTLPADVVRDIVLCATAASEPSPELMPSAEYLQVAISGLLVEIAADPLSRTRLVHAAESIGVGSLVLKLLRLYRHVPRLPGTELLPDGALEPPEKPEDIRSPQEALVFLEYQRRKVYNPPAVSLRKAILGTVAKIGGTPSLHGRGCSQLGLLAECMEELIRILKELHGSAPSCTSVELTMDGKCKGYVTHKYAADFSDNPAGDILIQQLPPDLLSGGEPKSAAPPRGKLTELEHGPCAPDSSSTTQIELCVDAIGSCLQACRELPKAVRSGLLAALAELHEYCSSPGLLARLCKAYGALVCSIPRAFGPLLKSGEPIVLVGIGCVRQRPMQSTTAMERLSSVIDRLDGNGFHWMTRPGGGLEIINAFAGHLSSRSDAQRSPEEQRPSGGQGAVRALAAAAEVYRRCTDRLQRQEGRGGCARLAMACPVLAGSCQSSDGSTRQPSTGAGEQQARGGMSGARAEETKATRPRRAATGSGDTGRAAGSAAGPRGSPKPLTEGAATAAESHHTGAADSGSEDEGDLRTVFDSSPAAEVRRERHEWRGRLREGRVLSWTQTSQDVHVSVALPAGTSVRDVQVEIAPKRFRLALRWFGAVVEGELAHRIKSSEATWSMDGSEAIVLLPKDDRAKAWRSLLKGDQEKGHFEMLKEMVAAEDEVQAYDDIPPESKRLIEEIRERQAMISEGLIDLENGFDDFRIAVGDD